MISIERYLLYCLTALALLTSVGLVTATLISGMNSVVAAFLVTQYMLFSPITYYAYWRDKSAAKRKDWRTPEAWLHTLELGGGWVAAFIAQRTLRHKSAKRTYQQTYSAIAIYHLSLWISLSVFNGRFGWVCFFLYSSALYSLRF